MLGYGDIAQRVAQLSIDQDIPVTAVRRNVVPANGITFVAGDVTESEFLCQLLGEDAWDIVITLTPDHYSEQGYRDSYLACAEALTAAATDSSADIRVIFISSTSVYGQNAGEVVNEQSDCLPDSLTARVLLETESNIATLGVPFCNLRFSGIYGPGRTRLVNSVRKGKLAAHNPVHWTNRIHANDCAGVIDFLLKQTEEDWPRYLIGSDSCSVPKREVQEFIAGLIGAEKSTSEIPKLVADEEVQQTGKRCSNALLQRLGYEFLFPDYKAGFTELLRPEDQGA